MNEQNLPPDELLSRFLDGELSEAEAEAVRRDPELAARAEALRRAADAVAETVTPPPGAEDAAVEAALADFDTRRIVSLGQARSRTRGAPVITAVAAAVAVGFIVAAAAGLFGERDEADQEATAAPPPAPAAAPADEPAAAMDAPPPPAEPAPAPEPPPPAAPEPPPPPALESAVVAPIPPAADDEAAVAAAEARLADAQAAAEGAKAEAAAAQAEADVAQAEAAAAQAEAAAAAPPPPPAAEAPDGGMDDMADDMEEPPPDTCSAAIGAGIVELQFSVDGTLILVVGQPDGRLTALDGATCDEIPPEDPTEIAADPPPADCGTAIGARTIELQFTTGDAQILIVSATDGRLAALDGATCDEIPPEEPG